MIKSVCCLSLWLLGELASAAAPATDSDYAYRAQAHDTLIGLSHRLLIEPKLWPALQKRNAISDPTHVPIGTLILIPRDWLKHSSESAAVTAVVTNLPDATTPKAGDSLKQGAHVVTPAGGYITLTLADGSVITLNPDSKLEVKKLDKYATGVRDIELKLDSGSLDVQVKPQGDAGRFQIRTPVAISAVRGTEFRRAVSPNGAEDRTEVLGGAVAVSGGAVSIVVAKGYGTLSDHAGPGPAIQLLPAPDLSAVPSIITDAVRIVFPPVSGAARYRAQIASDAEFHAMVAENVVVTNSIVFEKLSDGHYWMRVRSIDTQGLEGLNSVREFDRHLLLAAPVIVEPHGGEFLSGEHASFHWMPVNGASFYHFQLARDPQFTNIPIDHSDLTSNQIQLEYIKPATYYWRVASIDSLGKRGAWGSTEQYQQKSLPGIISEPSFKTHSATLSWNGAQHRHYKIQIARDLMFTQKLLEQEVDSPSAVLPHYGFGVYFARVQAIDPDGYVSPYSPTLRFCTPVPLWLKIAPIIIVIPFL